MTAPATIYNRTFIIKVALAFTFLLILLNLFHYKQDLISSLSETGHVGSTPWQTKTHTSGERLNATVTKTTVPLPVTTNVTTKPPIRSTYVPDAGTYKEEEHPLQGPADKFTFNLCPPIPPNLVGPISVDTSYEPLDVIEDRYKNKLNPGGQYTPTDCTAGNRVAIIVPYRGREHQLPIFLKNLHPFLMKQQIEYGIYIAEQTPGAPFNRAALMNIGFTEARKQRNWQCLVFHDIDLLPMDDRNLYTCPDQPRHMSVGMSTFDFKLPYETFFGGVSAMTVKQFQAVNGFSNSFWGWGGEDDDMSNRVKHFGFQIARYPVSIARYTMLSHKKEIPNPKRFEQLAIGQQHYDSDGLNSLHYNLKNLTKKPLYTWILTEISLNESTW